MAAITANSIQTESLGSCVLQIVSLTMGSTSDTYAYEAYAPVLDYWAQAQVGTAGYSPDVLFTASTGSFLITNGSHNGTIKLFILLRGPGG
jgi:hypothetical protein